MTPLRQQMLEDMQLGGLSEATQYQYVLAIKQMAEHYNKPPDQITEEEVRQYFLYLKNEKGVSRSTSNVALCAIKLFFERTPWRRWAPLVLVRPPREMKLPDILSRNEVQCLLGSIRLRRHQVWLGTIYACGLRRNEALALNQPKKTSKHSSSRPSSDRKANRPEIKSLKKKVRNLVIPVKVANEVKRM